jgi:VWFA-related protein
MNFTIPLRQMKKQTGMRMRISAVGLSAVATLAIFAATFAPTPLRAKTPPEVTLTITLAGAKSLPALNASNFVVTDHGQLQNVQVLAGPSLQSPLHVALVIEEGTAPSLNNQLANLRRFIEQLPEGTNIMVVTLDRNHANVVVPFTTDQKRAAQSVSIVNDFPSGVPLNAFVSLSDVIGRFKGLEGRKEIVMVGPGYDTLQDEISPSSNTDLQQAEKKAREENVVVHTIWIPSAVRFSRILDLSGSSNMADLATATGGLSFWNIDRSVVQDLTTRLNTIQEAFNQQYILRFIPDLPFKEPHNIRVKLKDVQEGKAIKVNFPNR